VGLRDLRIWAGTGVELFFPPGDVLSSFEPYEIPESQAGTPMFSKLQTPYRRGYLP